MEGLDDVRVIRDRQTSESQEYTLFRDNPANVVDPEQSRQFGFLRFSALQEAEVFMDRNYPTLYLYGDNNKSNADASKVRIAFGRERKDPGRGDDAEWICANVWHQLPFKSQFKLTRGSAISTTSPREVDVSGVRLKNQVCLTTPSHDLNLTTCRPGSCSSSEGS